MKVFVGGSKTITELTDEAKLAIDELCAAKTCILIGDCFGADKLIQEYLVHKGYKNAIVYVSGDNVRNNVGGFCEKHIVANGFKGYEFYRQKDIAMVAYADCGLMIWDGLTRGTKQNIEDLNSNGKTVRIIRYHTMLDEEDKK